MTETDTRTTPAPQGFAELVAAHDKGRTALRCSEELTRVLDAIHDTGKAGKITCTFSIQPQAMDDAVVITATVKAVAPEHDPRGALYWISSQPDGGFGLTREDPHQPSFADFLED